MPFGTSSERIKTVVAQALLELTAKLAQQANYLTS